jgi:hypothetical protein
MTTTAMTGKADLDDQRWLAAEVATLGDGIEAARAIWANWSDLRNVGRLHPGESAGDFIASQLGGLRLDLPRLIAALPEMSNRQVAAVAGVNEITVRRQRGATNVAPDPDEQERDAEATLAGEHLRLAFAASDRHVARVIGADGKSYPGHVIREVRAEVIEPTTPAPEPEQPEERAPIETGTHFWPQLLAVRDAIRGLSSISPDVLAAGVPARRRQQFAKDLRRHGLVLGAVAARLEGME